jgi:hypothetical protein
MPKSGLIALISRQIPAWPEISRRLDTGTRHIIGSPGLESRDSKRKDLWLLIRIWFGSKLVEWSDLSKISMPLQNIDDVMDDRLHLASRKGKWLKTLRTCHAIPFSEPIRRIIRRKPVIQTKWTLWLNKSFIVSCFGCFFLCSTAWHDASDGQTSYWIVESSLKNLRFSASLLASKAEFGLLRILPPGERHLPWHCLCKLQWQRDEPSNSWDITPFEFAGASDTGDLARLI